MCSRLIHYTQAYCYDENDKAPNSCCVLALTKDHLQDIFKYLDDQSLRNLRLVSHAINKAVDEIVIRIKIGLGDRFCGPEQIKYASNIWPTIKEIKLCCPVALANHQKIYARDVKKLLEALKGANWTQIQVLDASNSELGPSTCVLLAALSQKWLNLTRLDLQYNSFGLGDICDLSCGSFLSLEMLNLRYSLNSRHGTSAVCMGQALAKLVSKCPNLRELDISANPLGIDQISHLIKVELPRLQRLNLSCTKLKGDNVELLGHGNWPCLRELSLLSNCLTDIAIQGLCNGNWGYLEKIGIGILSLHTQGAAALAQGAKRWPRLWKLEIEAALRVSLPAEALDTVLRGEWDALKDLALLSGYFGTEEARVLADALGRHTTLTSLRLSPIDIDASALKVLFLRPLENISRLCVRITRVSCAGVLATAVASGQLPALRSLEFDNFCLSDLHFEILFREKWENLETLSFFSCMGFSGGFQRLAQAAERLPALRMLSLWESTCTDGTAGGIRTLIQAPWSLLRSIRFMGDPVMPAGETEWRVARAEERLRETYGLSKPVQVVTIERISPL